MTFGWIRSLRHLLAPLTLLGAALPALANPYGDYLEARILPGWTDDKGQHLAGLELTLAEGWKTYWRAPGSAGVPPVFDWSASGNLAGVEVIWPRPEVFDLSGMRSFGYKHKVVLPLRITPRDARAPVDLDAQIQLGICETVCVPLDIRVAAELPTNVTRRDPAIAAALAGRPYTSREARLTRATCTLAAQGDDLALEARLRMPPAGRSEIAVFESPLPDTLISTIDTRRDGDTLVARALVSSYSGALMIDRSQLRITVLGSDYAVEVTGCDAG